MTKIFSFLSLIVSITACALSGAFLVYRVESNMSLFPPLLLIATTFAMVIICTFNHYHSVMQADAEDLTTENDENQHG